MITLAQLQDWMPLLLQGLVVTLQLAAASAAVGLTVAAVVALLRISPWRPVRAGATIFVDIVRSIPLLALLIFVFFGLGKLLNQLGIPEFWAAVGAISISEASYLGETYRAALESVSSVQWDAANSLALTRSQTLRLVILPQAIPAAVPPTVNALIYIIKGTSLASLIAVNELTGVATELVDETFLPMQIYLLIGLMYLAVTVPLSYAAGYAERAVSRRLGMRVEAESIHELRPR